MTLTLLKLLAERRYLRAQIGDFVAKLLRELFQCRDPVRGAAGCRRWAIVHGVHDLTGEALCVSDFLLARPAWQAGNHWSWFTRDQRFERGFDASGIIDRHQPRRARPHLGQRLRT